MWTTTFHAISELLAKTIACQLSIFILQYDYKYRTRIGKTNLMLSSARIDSVQIRAESHN